MFKKTLFTIALLFGTAVACCAQQARNVLFIGNSYTQVNNLPAMVAAIAESMGDRMTYQSNTPGGCTFSQHCTNQSMQLIRSGEWDAVVLQEQSQLPSFPQSQVETEVFPYAKRLVDSIYANNPCCEPMFYMTWGRKDGDGQNAAEFPVLGTYEGMDSMLCERYTYMAQTNDASLCPVGRVWHYLRDNNSDIELYQTDGSHPSVAGTYAAACAFYVLLFHSDPEMINYNAGLPESTASAIRMAAHDVVYTFLAQWLRPVPESSLNVTETSDRTVTLVSTSVNADSLIWLFGDGTDTQTSASQTTQEHTYPAPGSYRVSLVASRHCMADTATITIDIESDSSSVAIQHCPGEPIDIALYPNPATETLNIIALTSGSALLEVFSCNGTALWHRAIDLSESVSIPVADWPSGIYIVRLVTSSGTLTKRAVVKH